MNSPRASRPVQRRRWLRIPALVLLALPLGLLLVLGVGEVASGVISGLQHFVQAAPLVVLAVVALRWPRTGGILLLVMAALLAIAFLVMAGGVSPASLFNAALLFGMPALAGGLFIASAPTSPQDA